MKPLDIESLEELTLKKKLAQLFNICDRSIYNYDELARDTLPEYLEDYPTAHNEPITRYPLTRYQCWVLGKIAWNLRLLSSKELTYFLTENYDFSVQFSKEKFETLYIKKLDTTDEV